MGIKCNLTFNIKAAHQLNVWVRKPWGLGKELFFFLVIWSKLFSPLCGWPDLLLSSLFAPQLFICKNEFKKHFRFPPMCEKGNIFFPSCLVFPPDFFFFLWKKLCEAEWKLWLKTCFGGARQPRVVKMIITKTNKKCFYSCQTFFSLCFIHEKKGFLLKKIKEFSLGSTWEKTFVKGFLSHCFTHE